MYICGNNSFCRFCTDSIMLHSSRTSVATPAYVAQKRRTVVIDATKLSLGRLASRVTLILRGKDKPYYTANIDCGDAVVIINAGLMKITNKKLDSHKLIWHTGYPGGLKERRWKDVRADVLLQNTIRRMMPKESPLAHKQMQKLRIYIGSEHPHQAQKPEIATPCYKCINNK